MLLYHDSCHPNKEGNVVGFSDCEVADQLSTLRYKLSLCVFECVTVSPKIFMMRTVPLSTLLAGFDT